MRDKTYFLNPLVIIVFMVSFSALIIFASKLSYILMLSFSFLLTLLMDRKVFIKSLAGFTIIVLLSQVLMRVIENHMWLSFLYAMLLIFIRLAPVWVLASIISSLNSSELLATFRMMRLPENLSLATAIFFRFMPEFVQRLKEVREGAKVRGHKISLLRPVRSFELVLVPLMFKALSISDTLSCAIISKGIEYQGEKVSYRDLSLKKRDYLGLALLPVFLIGGFFIW